MKNRLRAVGILLVPYLVLVAGCDRVPSLSPYAKRTDADIDSVPVVIGVAEGDEKLGKPVASPIFETSMQLHQVAVQIENVLRGNIPEHSITLYYFAFKGLVPHHPLIFRKAPSRRLIPLRKDGAVYRTAIDGWNCAKLIVTGAHPGYKCDPQLPLEQIYFDLNLTRGEGPVNSEEFSREIEEIIHISGLGGATEGPIIEKLRHLVLTESGKVKSTACQGLGRYSLRTIDESLRERARDSMKAAGCKCEGSEITVHCE